MFRQDLYPERYKTFGLIMLRIEEKNVESCCYNTCGRILGFKYSGFAHFPKVIHEVLNEVK